MRSFAIGAIVSLYAAVAGAQCTQSAPANPCAPGGGSKTSDCGMEWLFTAMPKKLVNGVPVADAVRGIQKNRIICYEGDPRCDFDADLNNRSCTFGTQICINNSDPRLPKCIPSEITTFEVLRPDPLRPRTGADITNTNTLEGQFGPGGFGVTVVRDDLTVFAGSPNSTGNLCSGQLPLVVPMLIDSDSGDPMRTVRRLRIQAKNNIGKKEPDSLQIDCRPSTCGDGAIQPDHETCDDNNRNNGDGCNQACQTETGPTNTPGPSLTPTFTSPPTATRTPTIPAATNTPTVPGVPTATRTPTSTFTLPATPTPTRTPTSAPPTPTATSTSTPGGALLFSLLPGGGTAGNCRGTCSGGPNPGASCGIPADCRVCAGGINAGLSCTSNTNCPGSTCPTGGTCVAPKKCVGGPYNNLTCANVDDCNGCSPNFVCTAVGVPLACCTGANTGNCPSVGSCAVVQNTIFPIQVALNGVCAPRVAPDRACASDAECVRVGKTCQMNKFDVVVGSPDGNGEASVTIPQSSVSLLPALVGGVGTVCVGAGGDGVGVVDCNGGRANLNLESFRDHNTTPGNANNSGSAAGLPDDASCQNTSIQPDGSTSRACAEGAKRCVGGTNEGIYCTADGECGGGTCTLCTTQPQATHTGICNSPTVSIQSGTFGAGDTAVAIPLSITILASTADFGADQLACTADDTVPPSGSVVVSLTTGTSEMTIYDATNVAGTKIGPSSETTCTVNANCPTGETCVNTSDSFPCSSGSCACRTVCGSGVCIASLTGNPISCSNLTAGAFSGLTFGGGFPALDTPASDIATSFQFSAQ